jgi:hypothetical protein
MVLNATFNNISDISSMTVNFIGGGNQNTWRKTVKKEKTSSLLKKGSAKIHRFIRTF